MPELVGKHSKVDEHSSTSKPISSTWKPLRPSGSGKSGDSKRPSSKAASRSPKRRTRQRTQSSSDSRSSDSSSDSDSATSSSTNSEGSKESPRKSMKSKGVTERPKASDLQPDSHTKLERQTTNKPIGRTSREQAKRPPLHKEHEPKRPDNTSRQTTIDSSSVAVKSTTPSVAPVIQDSVMSDAAVKHAPKTSKKDEVALERSAKERSVSPSVMPPFTRILIEKLTRNVNKAHITEIFSVWGKIHSVDMPPDRLHPEFSRSYAYVTYDDPSSAADAVNFMNGGQIDGELVRVTEILSRSSLVMRGSAAASDDKIRDRDRDLVKRESGRIIEAKSENPNTRRPLDARERSREKVRSSDETERRRERQQDHDRLRDRERDRERERRNYARSRDRSRRTRRGSSGSPFANRPGPPVNRQRSPYGSRYNRAEPPASTASTSRRVRSRSPVSKPTTKPTPDSKSSNRRVREGSSRSSSSSSSGSDSSNSSSSSSRSGSSSSSSSNSSRSRS